MIVTLQGTTSAEVGAKLVELREQGGARALGRVLTLVIVSSGGDVEPAVEAANRASREHPSRVVVIDPGDADHPARLDAEIRVGGDAGASEVVILRPLGTTRDAVDTLVTPLLLPDAPLVAWWPKEPPANLAEDPLGRMAQRRISDVGEVSRGVERLHELREGYSPGDTDLSWARTTLWRGLSAGVVEGDPGATITAVTVRGNTDRPSLHLLAAWFASALECSALVVHDEESSVISGVDLHRETGTISLHRPEGSATVTISTEHEPQRQVAMAKRPLEDCLMEDLRHLDPDVIYGRALRSGLKHVEVR
ncbi:glucose-6-phosphate dehydrogenase assembly protein OpcA [Pseudactinotalea sp. Z1748]|uniref:glucose-6-phosphate dehydrogenase assembly protein OpcA n=1 Tax=Pseudactinotalea sp. Z1748 TaxID=3413027 RepID=UPI003C7D68A7